MLRLEVCCKFSCGKKGACQVQCVFNDLIKLCVEAKIVHESAIGMLPDAEHEKHDVWCKAKMIINNDCISMVQLLY